MAGDITNHLTIQPFIQYMTLSFNQTDGLRVTFTFGEKIWSVRGDIVMPANRIKSAWLGMPKTVWDELRIPGAFFPGLIKAGRYLTPRGTEFWYVTRKKRHPVTIELEGCKRYKRLVLGFEDPSRNSASGLPINSPPGTFEIQST
jgi:hypothetical protein